MSASAIVVAAVFGTTLILTVAAQPRRFRWAQWIKQHDACSWIPLWTFFAPTPGVRDTRVLWREQLVGGEVGPWHEMAPLGRSPLRMVWNPHNRARKAVTDCAPMIAQLVARDQSSPLAMISLPYLMIAQHMAGLEGSSLGLARQFTVVNTQGVDTEDGLFEPVLISRWHRLSEEEA